jgi:hypothetical protein
MPAGSDTVVTHWTVADALVTRTTWHTLPSWPTRLPPLEQVVGEDYLIPWAEPCLPKSRLRSSVLCQQPDYLHAVICGAAIGGPGERYRDALNRQRQRRRRGRAELPSLPSLLRRLSGSLGVLRRPVGRSPERCAAASPAVMGSCRGLLGNLDRIAGTRRLDGWCAAPPPGAEWPEQAWYSADAHCRASIRGGMQRGVAASGVRSP